MNVHPAQKAFYHSPNTHRWLLRQTRLGAWTMKQILMDKQKSMDLIRVNCDCCSYIILIPTSRIKNWKCGPRCKGCGKVLGPMQWSIIKEEGEVT